MISKLSKVFHEKAECKEAGHQCKVAKENITKVFKPDEGVKNTNIISSLFSVNQPKLCDCVIIKNDDTINMIEIKCGKLTNSLLNDVKTKLENTNKILKYLDLNSNKSILIYKSLENTKLRQKIQSIKINGKPIIEKKFEINAIII